MLVQEWTRNCGAKFLAGLAPVPLALAILANEVEALFTSGADDDDEDDEDDDDDDDDDALFCRNLRTYHNAPIPNIAITITTPIVTYTEPSSNNPFFFSSTASGDFSSLTVSFDSKAVDERSPTYTTVDSFIVVVGSTEGVRVRLGCNVGTNVGDTVTIQAACFVELDPFPFATATHDHGSAAP